MMMVKQRVFFALTAIELIVLCAVLLYGRVRVANEAYRTVPSKVELVRELELTDLSVWTEARYTRHPSQADFFAPFQDFPSSIEHFPAGSIVVVRPRAVAPPGPESR